MIAAFRFAAHRPAARNPRHALLRQTALAGGVLAAMLVLVPVAAQAQNFVWSGATDGLATRGDNWIGGVAPQVGNGNAEIFVNSYAILPPTFATADYRWKSLNVNLVNRVDPVADTVFLTGVARFGDPNNGVIFNAYVTSGRLDVGANVSMQSVLQVLSDGSLRPSGGVEIRDNGTLYNRGTIATAVSNSGSVTNYATGTIGSIHHAQAVSNTRGTVDVYGRPNLLVGINGEKAGFVNYGTITSQSQIGGATNPNSQRYSVSN
ncbi:MAG: hypothetical protein K2Z25_25125, partial [Beijerinckiaceae bacterium]|nr:hypothetical protein [Beijerinckiaceae bacterium]